MEVEKSTNAAAEGIIKITQFNLIGSYILVLKVDGFHEEIYTHCITLVTVPSGYECQNTNVNVAGGD